MLRLGMFLIYLKVFKFVYLAVKYKFSRLFVYLLCTLKVISSMNRFSLCYFYYLVHMFYCMSF